MHANWQTGGQQMPAVPRADIKDHSAFFPKEPDMLVILSPQASRQLLPCDGK